MSRRAHAFRWAAAGMMHPMVEAVPWEEVRRRVAALSQDRQALCALACAEHVVRVEAPAREAQLQGVVAGGWEALRGSPIDLQAVRADLERRDDVDED